MVRSLQDTYKVKIDIEDSGKIFVSGEGLLAEQARDAIAGMTEEVTLGRIYTGKVVRVEPFGAFINILPGIDGMVHISQLADYRVPSVEDIAKLGDELTAMVIDVDPQGKVRMSRQAVLEGLTLEEAQARDRGGRSAPPRGDRNDRGGDRGDRSPRRDGERRPRREGDRGPRRDGDRFPRR
jgi:polyribonucleotide nucleotidyltransferase